jgi:hypothetical protein
LLINHSHANTGSAWRTWIFGGNANTQFVGNHAAGNCHSAADASCYTAA